MRQPRHSISLLLPLALAGCDACNKAPRFGTTIVVVDEDGGRVTDATATVHGHVYEADEYGEIRLDALEHPVLTVVSAPGTLPEPVAVGWTDADSAVAVTLLDDADGTRFVVHSAGDVMMGRRYTESTDGYPQVRDGDGIAARGVVADVQPAFSLAHLRMLNLETVVGDLPSADAYPAKRYLLQSHPATLAALQSLKVDATVLSNNHQRDWMDDGVVSTLDALDGADLPHVGSGMNDGEATEPLVYEIGGSTVGIIGWTSVDGDFVNDNYPTSDDQAPSDIAAEDAWKWAYRTWGEPDLGVETASRRVGDAWAAINDIEDDLTDGEAATLWASASDTFPELQDWVAGRGHGGAARWDEHDSPDAISALAEHTDLTIVQLHMGFQFADAPGVGARTSAHDAIDAGADLVVAHHPHVLQGMEWYKGKLIAYSMGNFVFDQDFLSTFPSAFLRTVHEADGTLVEARVVPLFIDRYRPVPVTGTTAERILRTIWERSALQATAHRADDGMVVGVLEARNPASVAPGLKLEHGTARILDEQPEPETRTVELAAGGITALPTDGLIHRRIVADPPSDLLIGRRVLGLGDFEDHDTDASIGELTGWTVNDPDRAGLIHQEPLTGQRSLELVRDGYATDRVSARTLARVMLPTHRTWQEDENGDYVPADGEPYWSVRMDATLTQGEEGLASVRVALYNFDDLDPTLDPSSTLLHDIELPLDARLESPGDYLLDLPPDVLQPVDGLAVNAALIYVSLDPADNLVTRLVIDNVEVIEWRPAAAEPDGWGAIDYVRSEANAHQLDVEFLPW